MNKKNSAPDRVLFYNRITAQNKQSNSKKQNVGFNMKAVSLILSAIVALSSACGLPEAQAPSEPYVSQVRDEGIRQPEKYENIKPLTQEEIKNELDFVISKIDKNLSAFTTFFPSASSVDNVYKTTGNRDWTNSFWTGMLWLAYEYTGNEKYKSAAEFQCESFRTRLEKNENLDHHDIGFLYSLSCVEGYKITGDKRMRETAIMAADKLITRYHEKGEFIQAWGAVDDPDSYRLIIDCMMNLPLLYWASEETGDTKYHDIAEKHANTTMRTAIREDGSTFHTYYFNTKTGAPEKGVTHQGYADNSPWSRGQAWAVYGFPLSYRYTQDKNFIDEGVKITNFFLNRLPEDYVAYWDLTFTQGDEERDSSAASIAVCGLLELISLAQTEYNETYTNAVNAIMRSLKDNYTTKNNDKSNGILMHAVYSKPENNGVDECVIWGDYYYMEALMRMYDSDSILYR